MCASASAARSWMRASRSVSRKLIAVLFRGRCMDEAVAASRSNRTPGGRSDRAFGAREAGCAAILGEDGSLRLGCPYCIAEVGEGEM